MIRIDKKDGVCCTKCNKSLKKFHLTKFDAPLCFKCLKLFRKSLKVFNKLRTSFNQECLKVSHKAFLAFLEDKKVTTEKVRIKLIYENTDKTKSNSSTNINSDTLYDMNKEFIQDCFDIINTMINVLYAKIHVLKESNLENSIYIQKVVELQREISNDINIAIRKKYLTNNRLN